MTGTQGAKPANEKKKVFLYEWTDDQGVAHMTDVPEDVPPQYRERAVKLESVRGSEPPSASMPPSSGVAPNASEREAVAERSRWQSRLQEAKTRLANAKTKRAALEQQRAALLTRWGSPAYAPAAARLEAEQLDAEIAAAQKEADNARNEIEVVIPEEARKAGVPPGWLRE